MPRRKKESTVAPPKPKRELKPIPTYKIKELKKGFDVLEDGAWLATYPTRAEAQKEVEERVTFHNIRLGNV